MPKYIVDYIIYAIEFVAKNAKKFKPYYMYDAKKNSWYYSDINKPRSREEQLEALVEATIGNPNIRYLIEAQLNKIKDQNSTILKGLPK